MRIVDRYIREGAPDQVRGAQNYGVVAGVADIRAACCWCCLPVLLLV